MAISIKEKHEIEEKIKKVLLFWGIGSIGYVLVELLWRGRTHPSMALAGGICSVAMSIIAEKNKGRSLLYKSFISALTITAVEFLFGVFFNIFLKANVWDYSGERLNILGQICPIFSLAWWGLAFLYIPFCDFVNEKLMKKYRK